MNQAVESRKYFDLHLRGLGYLSRVRDVTTKGNGRSKAKPFLACSISAFHGDPDVENGIVYLPLDLIVSGDKAKEAVRAVMNDANDPNAKVLVGFRSGDHYIRTFERTGNRAGETGAVLKGRLLKVFWIKVDGEFVYRDETDDAASDREATPHGTGSDEHGDAPVDRHDSPDETGDQHADRSGAGNDAAEVEDRSPVAGQDSNRSNRYPALRRNGGSNARRPDSAQR
jgi:hypothetical protein